MPQRRRIDESFLAMLSNTFLKQSSTKLNRQSNVRREINIIIPAIILFFHSFDVSAVYLPFRFFCSISQIFNISINDHGFYFILGIVIEFEKYVNTDSEISCI